VPSLTADDTVANVRDLVGVSIEARSLVNRPSASLTIGELLTVLQAARHAVDDGAIGVVVTQGTDTMEESAFLFDLLWDRRAPLVVTGAMRNPAQPGPDGPANLFAAVCVAASESCQGIGCVVVMNDELHAARYVRKEHSSNPAAFHSPAAGAIGSVQEGVVILRMTPARLGTMNTPSEPFARVALIEASFDDGGDLLAERVIENFDGLVIAGFGVGHLSEAATRAAIAAASIKPVVLASRCGAGGILKRTYGFVGSESQLLANGLISAGDLDARKARLLLILLLSSKTDRGAISIAFEKFGRAPGGSR
jgi:L-asparaginase